MNTRDRFIVSMTKRGLSQKGGTMSKDLCSECGYEREVRTYHLKDETYFWCGKCEQEGVPPCDECDQQREGELLNA